MAVRRILPVPPQPLSIVERPESNGSVSILPCTIAFSTGQRIKLVGGDAATVSVSAAFIWVEASSVDLYHHQNTDLRAWRSRHVRFHLRPGEVVRLSVEPKSKGSTYVGGWTIQRFDPKRWVTNNPE